MLDEALRMAVAEALGLDPALVTETFGQGSHERWDSLGQLKLMLKLEERFGVRFSVGEITGLDSVAKLAQALGERRSA